MKNIFILLSVVLLKQFVWSQNNTINSYQYWVDSDFANQQTVSVAPVDQFHLQTDLDLSSVTKGFHTFHIRFQDNNNNFSSILSQLFYSRALQTNVVAYEYWFDNDDLNKVNVSISPQTNFQLFSDFDCSSLTNGMHILHLRFKDDGDNWSSVTSNFFQKSANGSAAINLITSYRYWLDSTYTNLTLVNLQNPVNPYQLVNNFDLTQVPKGQHTFNIQFKDTAGFWSSILTDTITKIGLPIANFSYSTSASCDSTVLNLENLSIAADTYAWDFGDGTQSTDSLPLHTYYSPGIYQISLTVTDATSGLDSTFTNTVSIAGNTNASISLSSCDQQTSPSGMYLWTDSGLYHDTIPNSFGCDSILTINLTINHSITTSITESACQTYTAPDGMIYTNSGNYIATIPNVLGCDSTIMINLTINNPSSSSIVESSCQSYTAPDGQIYTQSGIYVATIPNANDCDSTITINLTVYNVDNTISQNGIELLATQNGATYQWIDCANNNEPIVGATNQNFTAIENGEYAVQVTFHNCTETSECVVINGVGINEEGNDFVKAFPNPTQDVLHVIFEENSEYALIFTDINGKIIYKTKSSQKESLIEMNDFPKGVYFLKIQNKEQNFIQRVVKM